MPRSGRDLPYFYREEVTRRGWLLFLVMSTIWGIPYLLIKVAVTEMPPVTLVFLRTGLGALLLVPLVLARGELRKVWPHWRTVLVYTLVEVTGPWLLLSDAEVRLPSSLAGLLVAGVPLTSGLYAWLSRADDRPDMWRAVGLAAGLAGVALIAGFNVPGDSLLALVEMGLVVVGYTIGPLIIARRLRDAPVVAVVALSLAITALIYSVPGVLGLPAHGISVQALLAVAVLGAVCTAFAFVLFFELIREIGPSRTTVVAYVNPAVALTLGVVVLHEPFTFSLAIGFALIAFGSVLATRRAITPAA